VALDGGGSGPGRPDDGAAAGERSGEGSNGAQPRFDWSLEGVGAADEGPAAEQTRAETIGASGEFGQQTRRGAADEAESDGGREIENDEPSEAGVSVEPPSTDDDQRDAEQADEVESDGEPAVPDPDGERFPAELQVETRLSTEVSRQEPRES
jgi:hypothetical protein